tara:strand:+ start:336 stop:1088 length:753 start_codon:yes stop_codon:yes gene_type:complete
MLGLSKEHNWKNATIMATASAAAYQNLTAFQKQFDPEAVMFDKDGTQVFCYKDDKVACVAFRGTEPTAWSDIKADLKIRRVKCPTGFVHRGFRDALNEVWPDVASWLSAAKCEHVFFTGHSLGGALATLAASRWNTETTHLYTFGSPRVGGKKFVQSFKTRERYRYRNNNDIVTKVPFEILGYKHVSGEGGNFIYFDIDGNISHKFSRWYMFKQWVKGTLKGFSKLKIDGFSDHGVHNYVSYCTREMIGK